MLIPSKLLAKSSFVTLVISREYPNLKKKKKLTLKDFFSIANRDYYVYQEGKQRVYTYKEDEERENSLRPLWTVRKPL